MNDGMRISVWVERAEPLAGHASRELRQEVPERSDGLRFEGWLGLLRVLSELLIPEPREGTRPATTGTLGAIDAEVIARKDGCRSYPAR